MRQSDKILQIALLLALCFHGSALLFTLENTYDAYVHIFFADHYVRSWFEPWEYRWYTGFTITSYPPLAHQLIAFVSFLTGLKGAFCIVALSAVGWFVIGVYRFSHLWVSSRAAAFAAVFAVFASSIVQAIHIYGQLPTLCGIACLMNMVPEVYAYFRTLRTYRLIRVLSLLGVTVACHHVTTIFGMVFFIAPVIGVALLDEVGTEGKLRQVFLGVFRLLVARRKQILLFGAGAVFLLVLVIFPYWYWSKTDPITQVPIPHGSRDSFINVPSSGLMFFVIPLGITVLLLPYIFKRLYTRRNIFLGISFSLLLLLGTGGTTPLPKLILGENAFNILTLDRFTFWASVIAIPFVGEFFQRLLEGDWLIRFRERRQAMRYRLLAGSLIGMVLASIIFIINLPKIRPLQPAPVPVQPILSFLDRDMHSRWRFLTLGFGDQMAWLSAQTNALSIDGNYHSVRRVPELTQQAIERLENAKFKGIQGIGSLQQFLTVPEKYHLKFIFSNDKFYDPILYFAGWERVQRLENGIMVWQKQDVPPLPSVIPRKEIAIYQKLMWGILPMLTLVVMLGVWLFTSRRYATGVLPEESLSSISGTSAVSKSETPYWAAFQRTFRMPVVWSVWVSGVMVLYGGVYLYNIQWRPQDTPEQTLRAYYKALDFKLFRETYSYVYPSQDLETYLLQLSVRDGLLASYSKLDSLHLQTLEQTSDRARVRVSGRWVTPLEEYMLDKVHELTYAGGKWWIKIPPPDSIPTPDPYLTRNTLGLRSVGKRTLTTAATLHEDVLDRPELRILSARLVKYKNQYVVVGELQNVDHMPAHVTVEAQLFDKNQRFLVGYNAKYDSPHKVLPNEVVPFRIDFEATAWQRDNDTMPMRFNPHQFTGFLFERPPTTFTVMARAVVADHDFYRDASLQHLHIAQDYKLKGEIINQGIEEISVPQLLTTLYDSQKRALWVYHQFLQEGIRPQHKQQFTETLIKQHEISIVAEGQSTRFLVNGLPQTFFGAWESAGERLDLMPYADGYVRLFANHYIGIPTIY